MASSIRVRLLLSLVSPDELRPGADFFNLARATAWFWRRFSKGFVHHFFDLFAQPAVGRIVFRALMPVHMNLKLLQALERKRIQPVIKTRIQHLRIVLRDGEQHVRFAHNAARGKVMLAAQNDPALASGAIQFGVDQAGAETSGRDKNMVLPEVRIQIQFTPDSRVPFAGHHNYTIGKQRLLAKVVTDGDGNIQNKVQSAAGQLLLNLTALDAERGNGNFRSGAGKDFCQRRQNGGFHQLPEADLEITPRMGWIKIAVLIKIDFQNLQSLAHLINHVAAKGSWHHVGAFPDKKRVLQQFAQTLQRMAHGRLRELQLAARAREIAFAVDGLQHNKKVKIDLAQMHETNFTLFQ